MKPDKYLSLKIVLGYSLFVCLYAYILTSCSRYEDKPQPQISVVDSIIMQSEQHLGTAEIVQKKSDSATHKVVEKKVRELHFLQNLIEKYNTERTELSVEKVIYRIDTVFIETEKNFWGKKKMKMSVRSDSSITETIDSTLVIDSLDNQ